MTKTKQIKTEEKYTITDIKEFLKEQLKWDWNEEIYDSKIEQYRKGFIGNFSEGVQIRYKLGENSTFYYAKVNVSENSFNYTSANKKNDLSAEWQNFLAQKENNLNV